MFFPHRVRLVLLAPLLAFTLSVAHAEDSLLKSATYCHALKEDQSPKDKTEFFRPGEVVCLSVELKGRPRSGIVHARFLFRSDLITETQVDVATVNKGTIFSLGESTFVGFTVTPNGHLPLGDSYQAEVTFDGKPLGTFPFRVDPPADAIPSKVTSTVLAHDVDKSSAPVREAKTFDALDTVVLVGKGDLGNATWLEANWLVSGKPAPEGTRSVTLQENKKDCPFYFTFLPKGGWPKGEHQAVLTMNGKEVARQTFTVTNDAPPAEKLAVKSVVFYHDDGQHHKGEEAKAFTGDDHVLHVEFVLAQPALIKGTQIAWFLVKSDEAEPQQIASATIAESGLQNSAQGTLTIKRSLPKGTYRADLLQGDTVVSSQEFKVGEK